MRVWRGALLLAAMSISLSWTPTGMSVEARAQQIQQGLCRRAPAPLRLPPEPASSQHGSGATLVPSPMLSAPPTGTEGEENAIVVTGTRIERRTMDSPSPVLAASPDAAVEAPDAPDDRGSAFRHRERTQPTPRPGLLTAGDHDDLLNPELYARYTDGFLKHEALPGVPRVDTQRVLTISVRDRIGSAVPFADVMLTCTDGNRLTLRTLASGEAVFFPALDRLGERVSVSVRHQGRRAAGAQSVSLSSRAPAQERTITLDSTSGVIRRFDLALVVDTTGSMSDELEYLKAELGAILEALNERHANLDIRLALVAYRDTTDHYVTRTFGFTGDVDTMQANLARQFADGGGDYPEAVEQAMARAIALDWRPDAVRSILFVADAPPHADDVVATWRSAEVARARRIQIVPVGASGVGPAAEYMMRAMAAVTQSRYIFLTDDSGIGNLHAPPSVDCYHVTSLGSLIQRVLDGQISGRRVEPGEAEIIRTVGRYENGRCPRVTTMQ